MQSNRTNLGFNSVFPPNEFLEFFEQKRMFQHSVLNLCEEASLSSSGMERFSSKLMFVIRNTFENAVKTGPHATVCPLISLCRIQTQPFIPSHSCILTISKSFSYRDWSAAFLFVATLLLGYSRVQIHASLISATWCEIRLKLSIGERV